MVVKDIMKNILKLEDEIETLKLIIKDEIRDNDFESVILKTEKIIKKQEVIKKLENMVVVN